MDWTIAAVANVNWTIQMPEAGGVDDRQQQRRGGHAEARVEPVRQQQRHDERRAGHGGRDEPEGRRQVRLAPDRGLRGAEERDGHREQEDREEDIRHRDEALQRRAPDLVEPGADVRDDGLRGGLRAPPGRGRLRRAETSRRPTAATTNIPASATTSVSVPMSAATGPDASAPTKLPAIAAAVQTGNRRLA